MSRFRLRPRARKDLDEIWDYGAAFWGPDQAERYLRRIERALRNIVANPAIGVSHMIFYLVTTDGIDVVRILHARMDFDRHL